MRKKIIFLVLAVVILFAFCIARDFFIKSAIGSVAASITGAPVHVGGLSLSLVRQSIKISDFKMYNPAGFPKDVLVDIPRMNVVWDLGAFFKGKIHLQQLDIEIRELGLAKNKEGALNVDSLKVTKEESEQKAGKKPAPQMAMQIDAVNLEMGRVVSKDYGTQPPVLKVYDIHLKKSYKDVTSAQQLAFLIMTEPMKAAGIQGAKVYAAAMLTGAAMLPVAAVFTLTGKDFARQTLGMSFEKAYAAGLKAIRSAGTVKKENSKTGVINGQVSGAQVVFKLKKIDTTSTEVTVSARKFGLPQPEVASGIIYRMTEGAA